VFDTEENKWNSINFSSVPFLRRYFHTCYSHNNRVYLFAGESTEETHYFNDIYVLDAGKPIVNYDVNCYWRRV